MIWSVIEATGWTYEYVLDGPAWINIRMMVADASKYVKKPQKIKEIESEEALRKFWKI